MKPGCILKFILGIIFTIGVVSYVIKTYGSEIKESAENRAKQVIRDKIESEIAAVKDDFIKNELSSLLDNYFNTVKDSAYTVVKKSGDSISAYFGEALKDSILDRNEITLLEKLIKK